MSNRYYYFLEAENALIHAHASYLEGLDSRNMYLGESSIPPRIASVVMIRRNYLDPSDYFLKVHPYPLETTCTPPSVPA